MSISVTEWLIIAAVVILLFGRGKVAGLLGDIGRGIRSFKQELAEPAEKAGPAPGIAPSQARPKAL